LLQLNIEGVAKPFPKPFCKPFFALTESVASSTLVIYMKKKILVLCTGNSCRSQMAEGYLRLFAGDKAEVYSAGVEAHGVNPRAIATMKEDDVDISGHTSNNIDEYRNIDFDFVITVCDNARERCPFFPANAKKFHRNFSDPAQATGTEEEIKGRFREVRQQIKDYCEKFVSDNL
jgi:arsenate reductase